MPEMFGTHHSKMMILLRHDDTAQVVITTANMIPRDWANMTQGVWQSPLLPLAGGEQPGAGEAPPTGSGAKFKIDLLNYLRAYNTKRAVCKSLVDKLAGFDFSAVRGALIASVPGRTLSTTILLLAGAGLPSSRPSVRFLPKKALPRSSLKCRRSPHSAQRTHGSGRLSSQLSAKRRQAQAPQSSTSRLSFPPRTRFGGLWMGTGPGGRYTPR